MQKTCSCGNSMKMKLRTVIYSGKVEIDNVPIFSCSACTRSEVIPEVKPDLTGLISQLGAEPAKQTFLFNECNEWANLLVEASESRRKLPDESVVRHLAQARVDELLDLYLLAQSLNDQAWMEDLNKRLGQLSRKVLHT
ncbi:hypothetical protein [Paenibacillus protaetiae]|uniref:YgiT-type zinc finger protein n=1 Tax=Paenibacillus protaetiae TaxID=2509456 RepID=A0A4P6ER47_9BACL|nr:hypothetical protein [Paenibacillus protaetiae]QAY65480.1 hypothetical protein ET464_02895 [Paenibacillus protaetiae]